MCSYGKITSGGVMWPKSKLLPAHQNVVFLLFPLQFVNISNLKVINE